MKRLSKKQKLIILIALAIIIIIISLIIGENFIKTNIINGRYSSANNNSCNGNLLPEYIKEGVTIGGVTGTLVDLDTSDANATAEDIIWKKTAYVNGTKITGTKIITVAQAREAQKAFEENTTLKDDYGNKVKVPSGFKVASDSATSVTKGVVIEDVNAGDSNTKGSQFVWIPIGNVITSSSGATTTITLGRYGFDTGGKASLLQNANNYKDETEIKTEDSGFSYRELLKTTNSTNAKAKDLEAFITKALSSGGYYLGRYEAGDATATNTARQESNEDNNAPLVCKKGVYPYTWSSQQYASSLCQNMYNKSNYTSDLINSYSWDTAIVFIQTFSGDSDYSRENATQSTLAKCGETHSESNYDVKCNIYDMSGNVREWSTETSENPNNPFVARGDRYDDRNSRTCARFNNGNYRKSKLCI